MRKEKTRTGSYQLTIFFTEQKSTIRLQLEWNLDNIFRYTEPQKKRCKKKYNSPFSLPLYIEIVYMCNDKILVQR